MAVFLTPIAVIQFSGVRGSGESAHVLGILIPGVDLGLVEFILGIIKLIAVAGFIIL